MSVENNLKNSTGAASVESPRRKQAEVCLYGGHTQPHISSQGSLILLLLLIMVPMMMMMMMMMADKQFHFSPQGSFIERSI